jgi:hypothetical protein
MAVRIAEMSMLDIKIELWRLETDEGLFRYTTIVLGVFAIGSVRQ